MYTPQPPTADSLEALSEWLYRELREIASVLNTVESGQLVQTNVAPDRTYNGMLRYADGTNWNPGSGEGVYVYYNSTWNYLG